jgi:cysteinyl-tRNA synthetase
MSKSRGNIVYLHDLIGLGYRPHHLRFYLCYGHYREKLNLDDDRLDLARGRVDTFRGMAARLSEYTNTSGGPSNKKSVRLIRRLVTCFENHMNDDLNVRKAFDEVHAVVARLVRLKAAGKIGPEDSRRIEKALARIDSVWRFLN